MEREESKKRPKEEEQEDYTAMCPPSLHMSLPNPSKTLLRRQNEKEEAILVGIEKCRDCPSVYGVNLDFPEGGIL